MWVEGSGPNRRPCGAAARCSWACTTPGSTVAVRASGSIARTRLRCLLNSSTTPVPTALPAIEVPAPREVSGTPRVRQTSSVAATSSTSRGRTTAVGVTRYSEASLEYSARVRVLSSTSARPTRRSASTTSTCGGAEGCPAGMSGSYVRVRMRVRMRVLGGGRAGVAPP